MADQTDHDCDCAAHNAQEMHQLVALMAEARGLDLCDLDVRPDADGEEGREDIDLAIIHDLAVEQGAYCPGHDPDDPDDALDPADDIEIHGLDDSGEHAAGFAADDDDLDIDLDDDTDPDSTPGILGRMVAAFREWTKAERQDAPESDFAGPGQTFPIADQADVDAAAKLIGRAKNPDAIKAKVIAIAKRKGLKLPDAWDVEGMAKLSLDIVDQDNAGRVCWD